jgi:3-hydroxyisobutyrate dehydrogenase
MMISLPECEMRIGFIGLGNVGSKLSGSLVRNGFEVMVYDVDPAALKQLVDQGAKAGQNPGNVAGQSDLIITCLPSPAICAEVMEAADGVLSELRPDSIWAEMSTTDETEVKRLGSLVTAAGAHPVDCPVSGGCHRAATGNISIFAGCDREIFDRMLPVLTCMGRRILHTGPLGTASVLKVVTNFLATANLLAVSEALVTSQAAGMDMGIAFEAIRISSGNSFVHETESQLILNGSRAIDFTMDLVMKDVGLFQDVAERAGVPLELSPMVLDIFRDGAARYGEREWSSNIIRRLEEAADVSVRAEGFPAELVDDEEEARGYEVVPGNSRQAMK